MHTGTIHGYDEIMVAGYIEEDDGRRRDFASFDVAQGQAGKLYNGALANFTPYTGQGGTRRAKDVRLASREARDQTLQSSLATPELEGTAKVIRYDSALGGFLRDNATSAEFKFSDRVIVPAGGSLQEGDEVNYELYVTARRGIWARSIRLIKSNNE